MFELILFLFIALSNLPNTKSCADLYNQCGGREWQGSTCCSDSTCTFVNEYYFQCLPGTTQPSNGCSALYDQCGGRQWQGPTCCSASTCMVINDYYSQCLKTSSNSSQASTRASSPITIVTTKTVTTITRSWTSTTRFETTRTRTSTSTTRPVSTTRGTPTSTARRASTTTNTSTTTTIFQTSRTRTSTSTTRPASTTTNTSKSTTRPASTTTRPCTQGCGAVYAQCAGYGWTGPAQCCSGSTCTYQNYYYSQCLPVPGSSTSAISTAQALSTPSVNDGRQNGVTTRYWDCCKASCAWSGKASVSSPVKTCAQDGIRQVDVNAQSGCNGGTAYMCNNQQPWSVNSTLSYGYAAASISGQGESNWCCACYSLIFTSGPVINKELIVQVTNTGGDLGANHFDLQMPGGGVGIFNGCASQFSTVSASAWGQQYGGISQRSNCYQLPSVLQSGCLWRFDWFMNADNPTMRFKQVTCPTLLTANTQCIRT